MTNFDWGIVIGAAIGAAALFSGYHITGFIIWLFQRRPW